MASSFFVRGVIIFIIFSQASLILCEENNASEKQSGEDSSGLKNEDHESAENGSSSSSSSSEEDKGNEKNIQKSESNQQDFCEIKCYCTKGSQPKCAREFPNKQPSPQLMQQNSPPPKNDGRSNTRTKSAVAAGAAVGAAGAAVGAAGAAVVGAAGAAAANDMKMNKSKKPANRPSQQQNQQEKTRKEPVINNTNDSDTCDYCTRSECRPTVKPYKSFNVDTDVKTLRRAVGGLGTDEDAFIRVLTRRSDYQIQKIVNHYTKVGNIYDDIYGDTFLKFRQLLIALITPLPLYYAIELHKALDRKDTKTMIEILTSLSGCAVREVSVEFSKKYDRSLPSSIKDATNLNFQKFLLELAKGRRGESSDVDKAAAAADAKALLKAGYERWLGTDEDVFIDIFAHRSFPQLREIIQQYDGLRKSDNDGSIEKDIEKKFNNKLENGLLSMVKNIKDQPVYFANQLHEAVSGIVAPNDTEKIIRILRARKEIDLEDIKKAFEKEYGTPLAKGISSVTWLEYKRGLLSILGELNV